MSKKNKKKIKPVVSAFSWGLDDFTYPPPKEGELRFYQQLVRGGGYTWSGNYKVKHDNKKVLQQYTNGEWLNVPLDTETIWVD